MNDILDDARTILQTTPLRWSNLAESLSAGLFCQIPAPNEWSALDCLQHMVDVEIGVIPVRFKNLLAGEDLAGFNPDNQGTKAALSPVELAAEFSRLRLGNLKLFDQVTPADLPRQARHRELGLVTMREFLHEWAAHDLMHTMQAERALLQPFIHRIGPWLPYFQDHVIGS